MRDNDDLEIYVLAADISEAISKIGNSESFSGLPIKGVAEACIIDIE